MLFRWGSFRSAAGLDLDWKIDCDALTCADWDCIAAVCGPDMRHFGHVAGVPTGGVPLATALMKYATPGEAALLVVDDVWTTGSSLLRYAKIRSQQMQCPWHGFVAFARPVGSMPQNIDWFAKIKC